MSVHLQADHGVLTCDARRCDASLRIERGPHHSDDVVGANLYESALVLGWSIPLSGGHNDRCPRHLPRPRRGVRGAT